MWIVFFRGTNRDGEVCRYGCVNMNPIYSEVEAEVRAYANNYMEFSDVHVETPVPLDIYAVGNIACSWRTRQ